MPANHFIICALFYMSLAVFAQELAPPAREIALYPVIAPGSEKWTWKERQLTSSQGKPMVQNVVRPVLQYYPATKARAVHTAMIVAPGGGFRTLMMSYEGVDIAKRLNEMGIDAFVLKYRLLYLDPKAERSPSRPRPRTGTRTAVDIRKLAAGDPDGPQAGQNLRDLAGADGQQAVRVLRQRAAEFEIPPDRIGFMGFSAGGSVTIATASGPADGRPNFAAPIYPPPEDATPPADGAPPLFIAVAADDTTVGYQACIDLFTAWSNAGVPAELHIFQSGGHGFGKKGGGVDHFMDRLEEWLHLNDWLTKPAN